MTTATIKIFLPYGDAKRLRTAEISNWTGKAVAAPRTEFDALLKRPELDKSGIYILTGSNPQTGAPLAYNGEAEVNKDLIKSHTDKEFWVQAIVFVSKDSNLTKSHIRYLEGRIIDLAKSFERVKLVNVQDSGARLPESDMADMEVFLTRIQQLLPVLGSNILNPIKKPLTPEQSTQAQLIDEEPLLYHTIKGLKATGMRTPDGFVVFKQSQAVLTPRDSAHKNHQFILDLREELQQDGSLVESNGCLVFTKDVEFTSPSTAAGVLQGGGANGLTSWLDKNGKNLKQLEST